MLQPNRFSSIELFSGCGILALGLSKAGFDHEMMVELNADAVRTARHNASRVLDHAHSWNVIHCDVKEISWDANPKDVSLIAGGPPCQPFSLGGRALGNLDPRDMWPHCIESVRALKPMGFVFENVKGLARKSFTSYLEWIVSSLESPTDFNVSLGYNTPKGTVSAEKLYNVVVHKVNAADFGTPQKRDRVVVAGLRNDLGSPAPLKTTHSRERLLFDQWCSGSYWARHRLSMPSDDHIPTRDRSSVSKLRKSDVAPSELPWVTVRDALVDLGEPNGVNQHLFRPGAKAYPGHTGSPLDQPSKALKAGVNGVPGGENMMVCDDGSVRYFTVREASRLQGLPDNFEFPCSWSETMRQLGNAVPVQLGQAIGEWMHSHLIGRP